MDYLTGDARDAYERLQHLKEKYLGAKIRITKIIETRTDKSISEKDLEKLANAEKQELKYEGLKFEDELTDSLIGD